MGFIKNIARKILQKEIESYRAEAEEKVYELRGRIAELANQLSNEQAKISSINSEKALMEKRTKEVEKENEILRKYYELDKEPSDEIKTKIHIDLEINRLKEEKNDLKNQVLSMATLRRPPVYVPQYYPYYGFGNRLF